MEIRIQYLPVNAIDVQGLERYFGLDEHLRSVVPELTCKVLYHGVTGIVYLA